MQSYLTTRHVGCHGRMYEPGEFITFGEGEREERAERGLLAAGAIEPLTAFASTSAVAAAAAASSIAPASPPPSSPPAPSSPPPPPPPPAAPEKPLAKMNKAELLALATAEGVPTGITVGDASVAIGDATNKQIIAAIEAKRAETAA